MLEFSTKPESNLRRAPQLAAEPSTIHTRVHARNQRIHNAHELYVRCTHVCTKTRIGRKNWKSQRAVRARG